MATQKIELLVDGKRATIDADPATLPPMAA